MARTSLGLVNKERTGAGRSGSAPGEPEQAQAAGNGCTPLARPARRETNPAPPGWENVPCVTLDDIDYPLGIVLRFVHVSSQTKVPPLLTTIAHP